MIRRFSHQCSLSRLRLSALLAAATLATSAHAKPSELWKINADGTGLARIADTTGFTCGSPEWSPDGTWIAYDTWRVGEKLEASHIAIIRPDGTELRNIGIGAMPSWSPDGKQLVFHCYGVNPQDGSRSDEDTINVMNLDGTGRETITKHWGSPRWCPRGNRILSILNSNLALYDLTTGVEHTILPHPYSMYWGLGVSRDARQFAFGGSDSGLYLATLDEQKLQAEVRTLVTEGKCHYPSFSPDGKRIVFGYYPAGDKVSKLYIIDLTEANPMPHVIPNQDPLQSNGGPNWSPVGDTIVFCSRNITPTPKPTVPPAEAASPPLPPGEGRGEGALKKGDGALKK